MKGGLTGAAKGANVSGCRRQGIGGSKRHPVHPNPYTPEDNGIEIPYNYVNAVMSDAG